MAVHSQEEEVVVDLIIRMNVEEDLVVEVEQELVVHKEEIVMVGMEEEQVIVVVEEEVETGKPVEPTTVVNPMEEVEDYVVFQ